MENQGWQSPPRLFQGWALAHPAHPVPVSRNKVSPITKSPGGVNISSPQEEIFPPPRVIFHPPLTKYIRPPEMKSPP